jgi:hypothetical protein
MVGFDARLGHGSAKTWRRRGAGLGFDVAAVVHVYGNKSAMASMVGPDGTGGVRGGPEASTADILPFMHGWGASTRGTIQIIVGVRAAQPKCFWGMCFVLQICITTCIIWGAQKKFHHHTGIHHLLEHFFWVFLAQKSVLRHQVCFTSYLGDALRGRVGAPRGRPRKILKLGKSYYIFKHFWNIFVQVWRNYTRIQNIDVGHCTHLGVHWSAHGAAFVKEENHIQNVL